MREYFKLSNGSYMVSFEKKELTAKVFPTLQ